MGIGDEAERDIETKITEVASCLADRGRRFHRHLRRQFERWESVDLGDLRDLVDTVPDEHFVFYKAVAETLGWLERRPPLRQPSGNGPRDELSPFPPIYLRVILEGRQGMIKRDQVKSRLDELVKAFQEDVQEKKKVRRSEGVASGLETWATVALPAVAGGDYLNLEEVQRKAMTKGRRARWTVLAPMKMYAIYRGLGTATPEAIYPPMGRAVSRGIAKLLGLKLGESLKDYRVSRDLHLKLAGLAEASIWDINSGLYRLGSGK